MATIRYSSLGIDGTVISYNSTAGWRDRASTICAGQATIPSVSHTIRKCGYELITRIGCATAFCGHYTRALLINGPAVVSGHVCEVIVAPIPKELQTKVLGVPGSMSSQVVVTLPA